MIKHKQNKLGYSQQRGLALIMSLVILLILTLLGVTSMNTSNLQTLMTSNSQYQTSALNSAEKIMQDAQAVVNAHIASGSLTQPTGYYFMGANEIDLSSFNWDGANVGVVGTAKYIIEYNGNMTINAASLAWRQSQNIAGDSISVFRITARAPASRGAMRYVQTIFVTIDSPNS